MISKKQEMMLLKYTQLKLQRNVEQIERLKEILSKDRIYSSTRSLNIIEYTQTTPDLLVPSIWNSQEMANPYKHYELQKRSKSLNRNYDNPGCCTIM